MALLALHGSVVAVTGGARGIGLATARALIDRGARVALGDLDLDLARDAAAQLGPHAFAQRLDVRQRASFEAFLAATEERFGPLDALVNNAGIMPSGDFLDEPDAMSDAQIDVNLRGVILGCKLALPRLLAHGRGHIVNVASMAGRLPVPGLAVYCATKFAVVGLTETLAEEYRDSGVDFTAVLPAKVTTELAAGTERAGRGIPTVSAEDVAAAIVGALDRPVGEVTVPRYLRALAPLQSSTPRPVLRTVRRALGDRRILNELDANARAGYVNRIARLAETDGPEGAA